MVNFMTMNSPVEMNRTTHVTHIPGCTAEPAGAGSLTPADSPSVFLHSSLLSCTEGRWTSLWELPSSELGYILPCEVDQDTKPIKPTWDFAAGLNPDFVSHRHFGSPQKVNVSRKSHLSII
ncbi:unnamed protein product [Caretta caretta]